MNSNKTITARDFANQPVWFRAVNSVWKGSDTVFSAQPLNLNSLITAARKESGMQDLGKDFNEEPLERLILSLNEEARLHPVGRFISRKRIINLLRVRLRAEYYFRKFPQILDQEVYPPILITGLQRTGTTKLHRLLSADPENRVLKSWEAINPVPFLNGSESKNRRIRAARTSEKALRLLAPGFFAIHPVEHSAPEEDILLLDVSFLSTTPEATTHVPSYAAWLEHTNQAPAYEYGAKLLRLLQWQAPGKRWVLKSPHHLEFLELIRKFYGEPTILWTHRELNECIPSFLSMVCQSRAIFSNDVQMKEVADHWIRKTTYMIDKALKFRQEDGNESLFTDIFYSRLVEDSMDQLSRIYERHGGITKSLEEHFRRAEIQNPKNKYGIHSYSYRDFGLEANELASMNQSYYDFFRELSIIHQKAEQAHD